MKNMMKISATILLAIFLCLIISARGCAKGSGNKAKSGSSDYNAFTINAPSNLIATPISPYQINLSWQDNSNNEDGFEVYGSYNGINWDFLGTTDANVTTLSDNNPFAYIINYYRVRAFNTIGDFSGYSNIAQAVPFDYEWVPPFTSISAGQSHSLVVASNGAVWSWGRNDFSQLGLGDTDNRIFPAVIANDIGWNVFDSVSSVEASGDFVEGGPNSSFSIAMKTNRTLWAWGANELGQLGLGYTESSAAPDQIGSESDWAILEAGLNFSLGVKTTGTLWAWGNDYYGQLGLGESGLEAWQPTPTQVTTENDWSKITAGFGHTLALKTTGTLWAWGWNNRLQLGWLGGGVDPRITPVQVVTDTDWYDVYAGSYHSIGLKNTGVFWSWGNNSYGQLGLGNMNNKPTPTQATTATDWSVISAGGNHNIALKINSSLWVWGRNNYGQLGLGTTVNSLVPVQLTTETNWSIVSAGDNHTLALKTTGALWVWGDNQYGQLGLGDTVNRNIPHLLGTPLWPSNIAATIISSTQIRLTWTDRSFNESGFMIERKNGLTGTWESIVTIGSNTTFYMDTDVFPDNSYYYRITTYNNYGNSQYSDSIAITPVVFAPTNLVVEAVSSTGINISWDDNSPDETGFKIERKMDITGTYETIVTPAADTIFYVDTTVTPGNTYYYQVKAYNTYGESGYSNEAFAVPEIFAPSLLILNVISSTRIDLSWQDNTLDEAGFKIERKIGRTGEWIELITINPNITTYSDITQSGFAPNTTYYYRVCAFNGFGNSIYTEAWTALSGDWLTYVAGNYHSLGVKTTGTLWAWGQNYSGQLGLGNSGSETNKNIPTRVSTGIDWYTVSVGGYHSLALKTNGTLWAWGENSYGQLGLGNTIIRLTPIQATTGTDWAIIDSYAHHNIALKTTGTLWSWGRNNYGQLGLGNTVTRLTPTQVTTFTDWFCISAGSEHNVALKNAGSTQSYSGTLWAWGRNNYGQLGLASTATKFTPVQVTIDTDWSIIDAGNYHNLALKTTGTLWAWGHNEGGQLGLGDDGFGVNRDTPTQATTETDWSNIRAGAYHSFGFKYNGSLWAWGYNGGRLGLGDYISRNTPTQMLSDTGWLSISAGYVHTLGLKTNGTLWAWGENSYGQAGLGDITYVNVPTLIGE